MDFGALWQSESAGRIRDLVNCHPACRACTHETMGLVPSLLFPPNALGHVFGGPPDPGRGRSPRSGRTVGEHGA